MCNFQRCKSSYTHIVIHVPVLLRPAFGCAVAGGNHIKLQFIHFYRAICPESNLDILSISVASRNFLEPVDAVTPVPIPLAVKADVIS